MALWVAAAVWTTGASAQDTGAGSNTASPIAVEQQRREVDVVQLDGGTFVPSGAPQAQVVPPVLLVPSPAPYPEALKGAPVSGTVELELLIDDHGAVEEAKVAGGAPDPALAAAALEAARGLKFKPGRIGAQDVVVRLKYSYVFEAPPPPPPKLGTLKGEIREKGTRKPLAGAALVGADGKALAEAGPDGRFEVALPPGELTFTVQAPGHLALPAKEVLAANQAVSVLYRLEPLVVDPYETIVRGEHDRTELSRHTLQAQELTDVAGTQGDPIRVVMLMPGVSSIASGISYPVVRGSQPAATGYYLDGVRIPALFHLVLGPAVFHPMFIDRIDFYPGIPPPQYGRVLGGVVDAGAARTHDDRIHVSAYADLLNAGAFLEYPVKETGTNVTVAGRVSYTPWLVARVAQALSGLDPEGYGTRPIADFYDYQARLEQNVGAGKLRLLAFGSSDVVGADSLNPNGTDIQVFTRFHRVDLRYRRPLPLGEVEAGATYGYEAVGLEGTIGFSGDTGSYVLKTNSFSARALWRWTVDEHWQLTAGADVEQRRANTELTYEAHPIDPVTGEFGPGVTLSLAEPLTIGLFAGGYASAVWEPTKRWTISAGVRADSYHLTPGVEWPAVEPRLTARHTLMEGLTLKAGAGIVHQTPTVLLNVPVLDIAGLRFGLQEARQVDAGVEWTILHGLELNVDTYFTDIPSAIEFDLPSLLQNQNRSSLIAPSVTKRGRSYGLELMLRHPLGNNWFGWISYTLQHSERYQRFVHFDDQFNPVEVRQAWLPFAFDQTHVFNAVVSYKFPGSITAGAVLHFNTGRPESGQVSSRTNAVWTDPDTGQQQWRPVGRDDLARLPNFFRLDARISKEWAYNDYRLELYLDVLNASLQREVLGYTYQTDGDPFGGGTLAKMPIAIPVVVPMLGLKGVY